MTNPNCEYGANFVAIRSLAAWSRCTVDGCETLATNDPVTSDIKLELGRTESDCDPVPPPPNPMPSHVYHPRHALRSATQEWLLEFLKSSSMLGPITKPQVGLNPVGVLQPSVNTCLTTTATTSSINTPLPNLATLVAPPSPKLEAEVVQNPAEISVGPSMVQMPLVTPLVPVMNSLVSHNVVVMEKTAGGPEPMEVISPVEQYSSPSHAMESTTSPPTPGTTADMVEINTNPPTPASVMQVEPCGETNGLTKAESTTMLCDEVGPLSANLTAEELELICDMFYLPWEHGPRAIQILNEFYWLKTHAGVMLADSSALAPANTEDETEELEAQVERPEWLKKKEKFSYLALEIRRAFEKVCNAPNRELVYNLYTYLWDIVGVVHMLVSYVEWLSMGRFSNKYKQLVIGRHTWFSGIREAFQSGDHEPWVFRGGLTADLQRLMPVDSGNDLFLYPYPDTPTAQIYTIRPFSQSDLAACYQVTQQTWDDGIDASQFFASHPNIVGEKSIGSFVTFYPELGFVMENSAGQIVGYVFAAPSCQEHHQRLTNVWIPELRFKYPLVEPGEGELLTPCEAVINSLHKEVGPLPGYIEGPDSWGLIKLAVLPSVLDASLSRRAMMLILACLRTCGTLKVLTEVPRKERYVIDLYTKLGSYITHGGFSQFGNIYNF